MTLQQLRYAITVAETGKITEAANKLYISQPSLTNAIHELEKEMNITIFNRTNKGIIVSKEGEIFLGYARQILELVSILEDRYKRNDGGKKQFCVSTQHYSFAVNAFVDLIKKYGQDEYDFSLRETQTYEIIEDVAHMRSEIGILFLNDFNETVIKKILKSHELVFHKMFVAKPHVFISRNHPLARKTVITNKELEIYPYLSFEQGEHNSFYFSEEIFSTSERKKNIRVRDRATLFNLLIGLNGYTVCSGVIDKNLNGKDIIAIPLADESNMRIGYITHKKGILSRLGNTYLEALKKYLQPNNPKTNYRTEKD
ncbi:LysR family transcriptional regulator [[Ruminococcus] gnavus]|jgi:DNA-binding transcriptional LysR family regulator|uniref:LysR family transcriptional regulator n=1 Tax=Mediterraneibacter gnavus TaxID=33038 RepID=A0A415RYZ1_MEDGN|nr:LysR family transcriptional regulator [Mediterraneibacter gnavus]MDU2007737.1 LysR family transcriptional regulator [Lachnospiraceae bacterium]MDB8681718.1 LysR family transcriptional regulator [Mediterraneibacter gnavus]MDB8688715.1 LysR family transcriptional regulator [Mediterraneibacter gnavus]MDB8692726.1 LysR family transcriptional regulator [Mediterraneibacter gnavus]RHM67786.1 LysR family transcriptional regulator [Mediterraneibacter gnavus]